MVTTFLLPIDGGRWPQALATGCEDRAVEAVHDLGGVPGFGAVPVEPNEPLFHEPWEARVWAMLGSVRLSTTIDRFRWTIEQMPPDEYLASSYYERWLWALERLAAEKGLLESDARPTSARRPSPSAPIWPGRYELGERVRVREVAAAGHNRVPRYLRRHEGTVERVAFAWPNPGESAATGIYGELELVYTVVFSAADLFGPAADHTLSADLGESDLETA
jgi:nitrile hydratase subunit beta